MYELNYTHRDGKTSSYFMTSRLDQPEDLKLNSTEKPADAVMIYAICGDGRIVMERQYRPVLDEYIYELPAGLCEKGESIEETAVRELFEETGMKLTVKEGHHTSRPYYPSVGVTDESISTVFGYAHGEPDSKYQEETEDITVVLADREECRRILREENVTATAAFMLLNYIRSAEDPFDFLI